MLPNTAQLQAFGCGSGTMFHHPFWADHWPPSVGRCCTIKLVTRTEVCYSRLPSGPAVVGRFCVVFHKQSPGGAGNRPNVAQGTNQLDTLKKQTEMLKRCATNLPWLYLVSTDAALALEWTTHDLPEPHPPSICAAAMLSGTVLTVLTVLLTVRFMMSCVPKIERRKEEPPWDMVTRVTDPVLQPIRGFMHMAQGDLDSAAVAMLAVTNVVQEVLFGENDGILLSGVAAPGAHLFLDVVEFWQRSFLLPCWTVIVLRWLSAI